ncbi:MAG: DUF1553 domain-containing protein, partial [Verrucomicrobiales bacterium]|nr:DUF1553 domain-containing protein [Verrucomicrobiales bacterium]
QPIQRPTVPVGAAHPIDAFVQATLRERGIAANPPADSAVLLRRLYLDVIGLPPTPEQAAAFATAYQKAPKSATEHLIDELLDSPHYGERWARHWLDIVRFAESNGFEMNQERPNAWYYRDYVIQAFNNDVPYDQFVREQLAGDQLGADAATGFLVAGSWDQVKGQDPVLRANQRADELHDMVNTVGATFLGVTLGCARCHDHKFDPVPQTDYYRIRAMLEGVQHGERALTPPDQDQRLVEIEKLKKSQALIDSQLAAFQPLAQPTRRMLLDDSSPPPTKPGDAGCIAIEQPSNGTPIEYTAGRDRGQMSDPGDAARLPNLGFSYRYWKSGDGTKPRDLFLWKPSITGRHRVWISWGAWTSHAKDARYVFDADGDLKTTTDQIQIANIDQSKFADGSPAIANEKRWSGLRPASIHNFGTDSVIILREGTKPAPTVAELMLFEEVDPQTKKDTQPIQPHLRAAVSHLTNTETFEPTDAKFVRFTIRDCTGSEPCIDELEIFTADASSRNVALSSNGGKATASGTYRDGALPIHQLAHLNDGEFGNPKSWISKARTGWAQIEFPKVERISRIQWGRDQSTGKKVYSDRVATDYLIESSTDGKLWHTLASSADRLPVSYSDRIRSIPTLNGVPTDQVAAVRSLSEQRGTLLSSIAKLSEKPKVYAGKFEEPPATHRLYRGDPLQPREIIAPGTLTQIGPKYPLPSDITEPQRRLALADWIMAKDNPLTARVIVNRLWQYHFGRGLVDTPSDFGINGVKPTHPELLDWLASELIAHHWSLKHIQRLILTSATFQQSSQIRPEAAAMDADARYLWRFPARRMEAEPLRDSILQVCGNLDLRMGGPGFNLFEPNENYVRVYKPKSEFEPDTFRRMIYQRKPRMQLDDTFGGFDCPDAGQIAPRRGRSTTSIQALSLLNSPFLLQQSQRLAERLQKEVGANTDAQVRRAFALLFTRAPTPSELSDARNLVSQNGLITLCRAMLNSSEFLYLP